MITAILKCALLLSTFADAQPSLITPLKVHWQSNDVTCFLNFIRLKFQSEEIEIGLVQQRRRKDVSVSSVAFFQSDCNYLGLKCSSIY